MTTRSRRISVHLSVVIVSLLVAVTVAVATTQYLENSRQRALAAEQAFSAAEYAISSHVEDVFGLAEVSVETLAFGSLARARTLDERLGHVQALASVLKASPAYASAYLGYGDGDFLLMRPLRDQAARERFQAPADAAYLLQAIERPRTGLFVFLDAGLRTLGRREEPAYVDFDPRARPWYGAALGQNGPVRTDPYIFFTTREAGTTVAMAGADATVAGVDITLAALSALLRELQPVHGADIGLVDPAGLLIAHADTLRVAVPRPGTDGELLVSDLSSPDNRVLLAAVEAAGGGEGELVAFRLADMPPHRGLVAPLSTARGMGYRLVMAVPEAALFAEARAAARHVGGVLALMLSAGIAIAIVVARHISRPLVRLAEDVQAIRRFDFGDRPFAETRIVEVDQLAGAVASMKETIRQFLAISTAMAAERDLDRMLDRLLDEIIVTTRTAGGVLYLSEGGRLVPSAARLAGARAGVMPSLAIPLDDDASFVVRAAADEHALRGALAAGDLEREGLGAFCAGLAQAPGHRLAAPLFNRTGELVGVLMLLKHEELDAALVRFTEQLSTNAALAVETRQLIAAQQQLFESFLQLIAGAIDAKSAYTAGHCARVPELTKMLAAAADRADDGPYAGFRLDEEGWQALHVAAWLHDCGKITTPEHVVDKATKLEAICDRIHEVRLRFEVLKRDARIAALEGELAGGDAAGLREACERMLATLDEEFAFVARCNIGGEAMSDEDIARLRAIGARTWTRTLDDRAGIAHGERARLEAFPAAPLPAVERLLDDKPEHRIPRPEGERLAPDNPWGFRIDVPELLWNRGELHNLSIRRGTLTDEERYKINEHIVQTIRMLTALPFPKHLRDVPELAGGHHEKMDGTGYPRRLHGAEMSPVARMMAIADVFEALTASDRPYKKAKTLSEALRIMSFMVKDRHIDPELYDLFLESGVWRDYAERFLAPAQIDVTDTAAFRRPAAA